MLDHIDRNLDQPMPLDKLAKLAHFSSFHFHRIFVAMVGETVQGYTRRRRLEHAAQRLRANPEFSITQIALDLGFGSPSSFARAFRARFGMSASHWRERGAQGEESKIGQVFRKPRTAEPLNIEQSDSHTTFGRWKIQMNTQKLDIEARVQVQTLDEISVAYVRHIGPYAGDSELFARLFGRIQGWAAANDLLDERTQRICVAHDDPAVTPEEQLKISVCVSVPKKVSAHGDIGRMEIPGGRYAVARFEVPASHIPAAWQTVMAGWLPDSGYQPDDRPCFERILRDPREHPEGLHEFEICVPVRPL